MRNKHVVLSVATLLLACGVYAFQLQEATQPVPALDKTVFAERIINAWNNKDVAAITGSMSKLYVEMGVSREEAGAEVEKLLAQYDKIDTHYRVLDFKQFPGTNLGSIKSVLEIKGVANGATEPTIIVRTFGYASVIFEDGEWRTFGTQEATSDVMDFAPDSITAENWPAWGTQLTRDEAETRFGVTFR